MRYADHEEYLMAAIYYLGTEGYWWARTPQEMARELSLDETKLLAVFQSFPGIFRKSLMPAKSGQHMYSLQARYAQRDQKDKPDQRISYIPPLANDDIRLLHEFVLKSAEAEKARGLALITNGIAAAAAVVSAGTAILVAYLTSGGSS